MEIDRRKFLRAALFVAAAPVIVRAASLMPVRVRRISVGNPYSEFVRLLNEQNEILDDLPWIEGNQMISLPTATWRRIYAGA